MKNILISVALSAAAVGGVSHAATVTYNSEITSGPSETTEIFYFDMPLFNPALGDLQAVIMAGTRHFDLFANWDASQMIDGRLVYYGRLFNELYFTSDFPLTFEKPNVGEPTFSGVINPGEIGSLHESGDADFTFEVDPQAWSSLIGNGSMQSVLMQTFPLYFECLSNSCPRVIPTGSSHYNLSITYSYLPTLSAVPEPSSWSLMIAGFALLGGAVRRNRTRIDLRHA